MIDARKQRKLGVFLLTMVAWTGWSYLLWRTSPYFDSCMPMTLVFGLAHAIISVRWLGAKPWWAVGLQVVLGTLAACLLMLVPWPVFAAYFLFAAGVLITGSLHVSVEDMDLVKPNTCGGCGYDLVGLDVGVCPECGQIL